MNYISKSNIPFETCSVYKAILMQHLPSFLCAFNMTNVPRVYWETVGVGSHFRKCIFSGIEWLHFRSLELSLHTFTWQQAEKCSPSRILSNNMRWFFNKQYLKQMLYWNSWQWNYCHISMSLTETLNFLKKKFY